MNTDLQAVQRPDRRFFLKTSATAAAGLSLGFYLPGRSDASNAPRLNAWVEVRADDTVVIRYARAEMGQGSRTSAPMLVAEELDADWSRVKVEYATAHENLASKRAYGDMAAVGSRTIRQSQEYLRKAGATARHMLVAAAAQQWGVPAAECTTAKGRVMHAASKRSISYGKLAEAAAKIEPPKEVQLKDPKSWTIVGKPIARVDIPDIVTGRIRYGIDAQVPGMLHAAVAACPVFNGKVRSMDASKVQNRRGIVKVLNLGEFVAVVADNYWRAKEALREVAIDWDVGTNGQLSSASIMEHFKGGFDQPELAVARNDGNTNDALAKAGKVIEAEYYTPYLAHATMEPMVCTAWLQADKLEI
ncbi:MAG: molybdopterin cofactor-binding domain-containing protein, partial [Betaproteobacteria bacterium]